jgi:hypothetical protein
MVMMTDMSEEGMDERYYPHSPPRTDILHDLSYRVNLHKTVPGWPGDLRYLAKRVRFTKSCTEYLWIDDFGGDRVPYQCTDEGTFRVRFHADAQDSPHNEGRLVCANCVTELVEFDKEVYFPLFEEIVHPSTGGRMPLPRTEP